MYFRGSFHDRDDKKFPFEYLCQMNSTNYKIGLPNGEYYDMLINSFNNYIPEVKRKN